MRAEAENRRSARREPRLAATNRTFPCGYGPRAILLSTDRGSLFVGCKDGSVTRIDLERAAKGLPDADAVLCGARETGVRSLCDLGNGWLLLGQDDSQLRVLRWPGNGTKPRGVLDPPDEHPESAGGIGYVGRWAESLFVVSPRGASAKLLRLEAVGSAEPPFGLVLERELAEVLAMSGFARTGADDRWLVCKSGALWRQSGDTVDRQDDLWRKAELERPGFVYDVAVVRDQAADYDQGIYLSTDLGVFLLQRLGKGFGIDPVYLPGATETCLAITHAVHDKHCFLWVSDIEGAVHLFWSDISRLGKRPLWYRSGLREGRFTVMRAVASSSPGERAALVGQACRNDQIVVSSYMLKQHGDVPEDAGRFGPGDAGRFSSLAEILSWGEVSWLRERPDADNLQHDWCAEALVADAIEQAGDDPEDFRQFLRNPGIGLACSALAEMRDDDDRAKRALTLWTHSLIGTVHRCLHDSRTTQDYLGIVRWLRRLGDSEVLANGAPGLGRWRSSISQNIQYARKWGVFGSTYAARQSVVSALAPLSGQPAETRSFDSLVYQSLLFKRHVDLEDVLPRPAHPGLHPWELRVLPPTPGGGAGHVAVSWSDGGAVYRRTGLGWEDLTRALRPAALRQLGGRILLGCCGGGQRPYLLSAPYSPESHGSRGGGEIQLRFLDPDQPVPSDPVSQLAVEDLLALDQSKARARAEAVYTLTALSGGRVVVGFEGTAGTARIGLLEVEADGRLHALHPPGSLSLPTVYPERKTLPRNPVAALASWQATPDSALLYLGCRDGQIWELAIRIESQVWHSEEPRLVGRLGSAITALACRATGPGKDVRRVFAGAADGTLVAFQDPESPSSEPSRASFRTEMLLPPGVGGAQPPYVTIWATQEQGPVRSLHTWRSREVVEPQDPDGDMEHGLLLALTQAGTAIVFLDRLEVERPHGEDSAPRRLKVPGERLGRFSLGSPCFGSALWPVAGPSLPRRLDRELVRFAVVPSLGGPRLLSIYYPKYTHIRQQAFDALSKEWMSHLGHDGRIDVHLLRRQETTYVVAPELPAFLVRVILGTRQEPWSALCQTKGESPHLGPIQQWLPRHLRPLADLDAAWRAGSSLRGKLKACLMAARHVGDRALFKEILEAALSRANRQLYLEAKSGGEIRFRAQFSDLLDDLEDAKGAWQGSPGNLDTRMRITIAKSLLDGDTLWSLSRARFLGVGSASMGAKEAMRGRVELVHRFLDRGDMLLALETLRAANLALLRLCRRLVRSEDEDWRSGASGNQLHWETISGFYRAVGDFAARIAHPKGGLGEVAAHEICRAYALGVLACPPSAIRLMTWMAEADLPSDLVYGVERQLHLLASLLGPDFPRLPQGHLNRLRVALGTEPIQATRSSPPNDRSLGRDNAAMIRAREPFDRIVYWLQDLAEELRDRAGDVRLETVRALMRNLDKIDVKAKDQYRHSIAFWRQALGNLNRSFVGFPHLFAPNGGRPAGRADAHLSRVRPELVLFSKQLGQWCRDQQEEARALRARYQLFEPAGRRYEQVLAQVERAADGFRSGAAVQKNLVLGVLGHGLLELLDEHLLEVWEVAQALDPRHTWERDLPGNDNRPLSPASSTAARFAEYLLQRALKAEVVPKNLRSLQGLLGFSETETIDPSRTLRQLLRTFEGERSEGWTINDDHQLDYELDARSYHFLHLTLRELAQNDHLHGLRGQPGRAARSATGSDATLPRVWVADPRDGEELALLLRFHFPRGDREARDRTQQLASSHLQEMLRRREQPRVPSHGAGLYLANLAASVVGWKLDVEPPRSARLTFRLALTHGALKQ